MSFKLNSLYLTDGYKPGHKKMLAPNVTRLYGTFIPRSVKHAAKGITKIVSFYQQAVWKKIHDEFEENFFMKKLELNVQQDDGLSRNFIERRSQLKAKALSFVKDMSLYLGMEYDGKHFEELWDLGYLPIKVKALPEGIETNPNIPHMTFVNTVDGFAWLTLYLETIVSNLYWKATTAATIAKLYRRQAEEWVAKTDANNMWLVDFMCHDFSARGLSGVDDMIAVGLGHATSFKGSDTLAVIPASRYYYGLKEDEMPIFSVNASEHSVSTTKIFTVGEQQMIADWLKIFPKGILSIVADTFDLWKLITEYLPANKDAIMAREGKLVIRPDSGDPVDIICGYKDYKEFIGNVDDIYTQFKHQDIIKELYTGKYYQVFYGPEHDSYIEITNEGKGVIELLWDIFGGTVNEQGFKVLDPHIGAIYGDSINPERQVQIYERLAAKGFAATNIVLGVGSFTYQYITRDTLGFAAKGAWFETNVYDPCPIGTCKLDIGKECHDDGCMQDPHKKTYNIYKDPITDEGKTKKSLKGLLCVVQTASEPEDINGEIVVVQECSWEQEAQGLLQVIYEDGYFYNQTTLTQVRNLLSKI